MHTQLVEFELQGVGLSEYEALCEELAPTFAEIPGLISKVWIADPDGSRAGGIYTWADSAACNAYLESDLFQAALANPALANLRSRRFGVLEGPTAITGGLAVQI